MEVQSNSTNLFANEKPQVSVEPSPRFGDDSFTYKNQQYSPKHNKPQQTPSASLLTETYLKQLNQMESNSLQDFLKNNILNYNINNENDRINHIENQCAFQIENNNQNTINNEDKDRDDDDLLNNYNNLSSTQQLEALELLQKHQSQQLQQQQQCSTQDDLHDFSFSQQLDNSSCIDEQSSMCMNNHFNHNNTITMSNSNNIFDSIKRKPRRERIDGQKQTNDEDENNNYIIDSDMESILMQSPPSNNQDAFKKFCGSMSSNNVNGDIVINGRESIQSITSLKQSTISNSNNKYQSSQPTIKCKVNLDTQKPQHQNHQYYQSSTYKTINKQITPQRAQSAAQNISMSRDSNTMPNSGIQIAFQQSLSLVESKWSDFIKWPESSPLRIELFALEMQSVYGSYYRNKVKVDELINNLVKEQSNRLAYLEAWKHKFRKTQKETMLTYIQQVEKNREFLENLCSIDQNKKQKLQSQQQINIQLLPTQSILQEPQVEQQQQNLNHQQSLEDLSPRQPPIMIQNDNTSSHGVGEYVHVNSIHSNTSSKSQQRRKRADRGRSKTPPGALQQQQNQDNKQNQIRSIPKLDINKATNYVVNSIESCRDQELTKQSQDQIHLTKIVKKQKQKDQSQTIQNSKVVSSQLSPDSHRSSKKNIILNNNEQRVSLGSYKNPFKKLVQQKQKMRAALLSPQPLNSSPTRHKFTGTSCSIKSPRQQTIDLTSNHDLDLIYKSQHLQTTIKPYYQSPKSMSTNNNNNNLQQQQLNSSNESSPDMPAQLDPGRFSVYSQNQLIKSSNQSIKDQTSNVQSPRQSGHESTNIPVLNLIFDISNNNINDQQLFMKQSDTTQQLSDNDMQKQFKQEQQIQVLKINEESIQVQQIQEESQKDIQSEFQIKNDQNANNQFYSYRSDELQQEVLSMYEDLVNDDNDNVNLIEQEEQHTKLVDDTFNSPNKSMNKTNIDETMQNIIIDKNINQSSPPPKVDNVDLDSFIKSEILHSDRSKKSVRFSEDFTIQQNDNIQNQQQQIEIVETKSNDKFIVTNYQDKECIVQEPIRISLVQEQNNNTIIVKKHKDRLKSHQHNPLIQSVSTSQQDCNTDQSHNYQQHTMDCNSIKQVQQNYDYDQQQQCYQTQETEMYQHNTATNSNDNKFTPRLVNISLTPQNKTKQGSFSFFKPKANNNDNQDQQQTEEIVHNFDVLSQQDVLQQGKFSPCLSRISKLKKRKNYCFKNYVTFDLKIESPRDNKQTKQKIKSNSPLRKLQNDDNFEQINLESIPSSLLQVIQAYNQSDSLFNNCLLTNKTINDIVKYQDENSAVYNISQLRLDSQQQQYFRETFNMSVSEFKQYSLIKSHAQFYIPNANKLYTTLQNPDNRIYNQTGQVSVQKHEQEISIYTINKVLNKYEGLMRSRQANMIYYTYQLKEEDGLIIIIKSVQDTSLFKRFQLFQKDYDNYLQIIKLKTIEQGTRTGDKDLVDIKLFYCVDFKLLIDDELKQNNLNIGLQEVKEFMDSIRVYDREL